MKYLNSIFLTAAAVACLLGVVSCKDGNQEYEYYLRVVECISYSDDRCEAVDSLQDDIIRGMGLKSDVDAGSVYQSGTDAAECDQTVVEAFRNACQALDANDYGGKYKFHLLRVQDSQPLRLDSALFVAEAENKPGIMSSDGIWFGLDNNNKYIYALGLAKHKKYGEAKEKLKAAEYTVCSYDLNYSAGGDYLLLGCQYADANVVTDIKGEVENDEGEMEERKLTAREAAISYLLISYGKTHPASFKGPSNITGVSLSKAEFLQVKSVEGGDANGNLNQGVGGDYVYLWYTTFGNDDRVVSGIGSEYYYSSKNHNSIVKAVTINSDGTSSLKSDNADTNYKTGSWYYSYLMFETREED